MIVHKQPINEILLQTMVIMSSSLLFRISDESLYALKTNSTEILKAMDLYTDLMILNHILSFVRCGIFL